MVACVSRIMRAPWLRVAALSCEEAGTLVCAHNQDKHCERGGEASTSLLLLLILLLLCFAIRQEDRRIHSSKASCQKRLSTLGWGEG